MNEEEFLNKSISYLRKEMEAEEATGFEQELENVSDEHQNLFSRLKESHSVMGDLVPMAKSLKVGEFSPWEVQWLEFASKHDINEGQVGDHLKVLQTQTKYWKVAAIAALLVACLSVGSLMLKQGNPSHVAKASESLATSAELKNWISGNDGTEGFSAGASLTSGKSLVTGIGGKALLAFTGVSVLAAEDTSLVLEAFDDKGSLHLKYGELCVRSSKDCEVPVRTDLGNVVMRNPGVIRLITGAAGNGLWIGVAEGSVDFVHSGGSVEIASGQRFEVRGDSETLVLQSQKLTEEELEEIKSMAQIDF